MRALVLSAILFGCSSESCPEFANACPDGCHSTPARRYDAKKTCFEEGFLCWREPGVTCVAAAESCALGLSSDLYLSDQECSIPRLENCSDTQFFEVRNAPSCSAAITCPIGAVSSCPQGCEAIAIQKWDALASCLRDTTQYICMPPGTRAKCLGQVSCRTQGDALFRVASACMMDDFGFCAGAEDTKVLEGSSCRK